MGNLKFGDKSTKDLGLIIQFKPNYSFPERDTTVEHIPGRNGDIVIDNGCYQNVTRTYSVAAIFNPAEGFVQSATKIVEWLTKTKGYQRLEDTYEPEVFRLARFNSSGSLPNYYDRATVFEINFDCKPQRFLKEGEIPIEFVGSEALLENPTEETANPLITIRGLEQQADDSVLLASVLDNDGKATSLMTLSAIPSDNIHIDSEAQDVYSDTEDLKQYVSLNGYSFPKLGKKNTTIKVASYKESPSGDISAYNTLINNNKKVLYAKYLPYDKIVESKQKSYGILPFDLLKQKKQEVYEAKAYSAYCLEKAESYTIQSINDLLTQYGYSVSIIGTAEENFLPDWLSLTNSADGKETTLSLVNNNTFQQWITDNYGSDLAGKVSLYGVFIKNNVTKDIKYYTFASGTIQSGLKVTSTNSFEFYFAKVINSVPMLYLDYDMNNDRDLIKFPSWLGANFNYDLQKSYQVTKVIYRIIYSGFIYVEKSGLFGKSKWETIVISQQDPYKDLDSVTWASYKKAFISLSGLSVDVHKTFTYRYLSVIPQYEPVMGPKLDPEGNEVKDAMGNIVQEEKNKVHFTVSTTDINSNITFSAKETGYYRVENDTHEADQIAWVHYNAGNKINEASSDGTKSNIIYYLESIPNYSEEDNFPDWIDPQQIPSDEINASKIRFKALKNGFFSCGKFDDEGVETKSQWTWYEAGTTLPVDPFALDHDKNATMYWIEAETNVFPVKTYSYTDQESHITIQNIGFFELINGEEVECENNIPPSWVKVTITQPESEEEISDSDKILHFITNSNVTNALYKWDSGLEWTLHATGYEMTKSTYDQDTTIEYLAGYPEYIGETWQTLYDYEVLKLANGNPTGVKFTVKEDGYYRPEGVSNWKYMLEGEEVISSKSTEMTNIYNLAPDQEADLSNVEITVIPRWWKL